MSRPASVVPLQALSSHALVQQFLTLEAPSMEEMHGDFDAVLLRQPTAVSTLADETGLNGPWARWMSKGLRPVDAGSGRGYNAFGQGDDVVQRFAMRTRLAPSRYDGRPALCLIYRAFMSACGPIDMVDELRRVEPGVYLGIGTWGFTENHRHVPLPFLLRDTGRPYLGDVDTPRKDLVAASATRTATGICPPPRTEPPKRDRWIQA